MTDNLPATSVFLDAIKVLEQRGWCQGAYFEGSKSDGQRCLASALALASGSRYLIGTEDRKAEAAVARVLGLVDADEIEKFNDDPSTTYEDVILALKRAHEAWEAEQP